jgi:indolepyruvate ferredoxin oxidoreductase, alpha subunit
MPRLSEQLLNPEPWSGLMMGNYALARAMIDTGTQIITSFPGSPTPEIASALTSISEEQRPFYFEYSTNEKVALEVAAGGALNGHLSAVFFKSVGLNVAMDSLIQQPMMNLIGGLVVILGDDPGANSSQNEQDNRFFSRMSYMPMIEPGSPQETYDLYREATQIAAKHRTCVAFRMTTHICHAREVVHFQGIENTDRDWTPIFDKKNGPYVPITQLVFPLKRMALRRLETFEEVAQTDALCQVLSPNGSTKKESTRRGLISYGLPANCLIENLNGGAPVDLLKLGMTYPLPTKKIINFIKEHDEVLIVEELDRVLETEIKALCFDEGIQVKLIVREGIEELMGELGPRRTYDLLSKAWPDVFPVKSESPPTESIAPRLPQMCPGCGHRSAFHAIKAAIDDDTITVADIGCHTLGFMPPYEIGEILFSMGASVPIGSGLAINNSSRKVLTLLGDATTFHAGLPGIINAVIYNHNITLVLMDNGTTAMTGHQPRMGSGEVGEKIPIKQLLESLGVTFIREADTYSQAKLTDHIKDALSFDGFAVVIAKHPCMLKFTRERQRKMPDVKMPQISVNQDKCDRSMVCVSNFGCPSFQIGEDGEVTVHKDLCVGDGSCLQTCPVSALDRSKAGGDK